MKDYTDNYDIKKFTYVKESKCFASEASILGIKPGDKFPYMSLLRTLKLTSVYCLLMQTQCVM